MLNADCGINVIDAAESLTAGAPVRHRKMAV
jgi:hypothetical protein